MAGAGAVNRVCDFSFISIFFPVICTMFGDGGVLFVRLLGRAVRC